MFPVDTRAETIGSGGKQIAKNNLIEDIRSPALYLEIYHPLKIEGNFRDKSIVSVMQFGKEDLEVLFAHTRRMREAVRHGDSLTTLRGKVVANIFYEPSTRTDLSFQAAIHRMGGQALITGGGIHYSSVTKGESLADTVRTAACYADAIVLRHSQVGASYEAAYYVEKLCQEKLMVPNKPVISAGDGVGEHPTQALLDIFTIKDHLKEIDGLVVALLGDLKNGRTVHSLSRLLALYEVKIICASPEQLRMPKGLVDQIRASGCVVEETDDLVEAMREAKVSYLTRVQKERFDSLSEYEEARGSFIVTPDILSLAPNDSIFMHPLPRVYEMGGPEEQDAIDADPRSVFFSQMENGMYVRMALLKAVLGR